MQVRTLLLCGAISVFAAVSLSQSTARPLTATYRFWGRSLTDPSPNEAIDRVIIQISGEAARELFEQMPMKASREDCTGLHSDYLKPRKYAGGLQCIEESTTQYRCSFALLLANGTTDAGEGCV